ncbi:MAG: NADH-quinone oxidoreductase subunit C [Nanoarchaeota archaeon]|nr:NADH-quinone oxidoreductase subunit C [Nanoarchaeota archaeon]MBU2519699.1 NADH-quinone oxidoreductase subunit C [Nanoarchaeota archaeon]
MISHMGKVYKKGKGFTFVEVPLKRFESTMEKLSASTERITSICGHDNGSQIEILYHFVINGKVIGVKFMIPRKNPKIPTAVGYFPAAELYERETYDMLGVKFEGNRNLKPILLDEELSPKTPLKKGAVKIEGKKG